MRLAIMGLKGHHKPVLTGAQQLGGVKVVAVSDDLPENIEKFKKEQPLGKEADFYPDWRLLLQHAVFDFCVVGDENYLRDDQVVALAERNVHVIAEKPLAISLEKLARIRTGLAKSKSRLTMLLTMRFDPLYVKMRELIRAGAIGEPCQASSQKSYQLHTRPEWFKHRDRLGGIIPFIGVHALDLIRWCSGQDFTQVAAFQGRIGVPEMKETENHASVLLRMSNGGSAAARLDFLRPMGAASHGDDRLRIAGDAGTVEIGLADKKLLLLDRRNKPQWIAAEPSESFFVDFVNAVRSGRPSRIPTEDCFRITEVALLAREAAETGRMIAIPSLQRMPG